MTLTVSDYLEVNSFPGIEVARVSSDLSSDTYTSKKFHRIKNVQIQNHGATFATGVARDSPKFIITQGSSTTNAKVSIIHTDTTEVFSLLIIGEY